METLDEMEYRREYSAPSHAYRMGAQTGMRKEVTGYYLSSIVFVSLS